MTRLVTEHLPVKCPDRTCTARRTLVVAQVVGEPRHRGFVGDLMADDQVAVVLRWELACGHVVSARQFRLVHKARLRRAWFRPVNPWTGES